MTGFLPIGGGGTAFQIFTQSDNNPGIYADAAARDVYFAANPSDLARLNDDEFLIIKLLDNGSGEVAYQQRQDPNWVDVTSLVQGEQGVAGATGNSYFFKNIASRDAFFNKAGNETLLENGLPVVVNEGNAVTTFVWTGVDSPVSYDASLFIEQSINTGPGTLFLGLDGANLSSAGESVNFVTAYGDKAVTINTFFNPKGSMKSFQDYFHKNLDLVVTDVFDTQLSDPQSFGFLTALTAYTDSLNIRPATTGVLRVRGYAGTDNTFPILEDTRITIAAIDIGNVVNVPITGILSRPGTNFFIELSGVDLFGGLQTSGAFSGQTKPFLETVIHFLDSVRFLDRNDLDQYILLNPEYTTTVAKTGGIVVNTLPTATNDTFTDSDFIPGVTATSNPTLQTIGSNTFTSNDIILIVRGTEFIDSDLNDGIYEVVSHVSTTLTIKGIGLTQTTEDFVKDQFSEITSTGTITKIEVAVLRADTNGAFESAFGATTPLVYSGLGGAETLAETLSNGNTTGGSNLVMSVGDKITSPNNANGNPITIEPSGGSNAGGTLNLLGGDSSFGDGGDVNIIGGNGPEIQGGDVNITGGIANGSDGLGGDVFIIAGRGGTSSGPGGIVTITSGNSGNNDEASGNVEISTAPGGTFGGQGVLLLQKDGGNVGIGIGNPSHALDIESGDTNQILRLSTLVGNSAAVFNFNSVRGDTGNLSIINFQHNDVTVTEVKGVITNTVSNFGDLRFSTKGAGGFGERMTIDEDGKVGIGTTEPLMQFQVNPSLTSVGTFDITDLSTAMISTATNNGGNIPAAPETALLLSREGIQVESFANLARFDISRFENVGSDSKTQLDIRLSDGSLVTEGSNTPIIMSLRSNGSVGIGTVTFDASALLELTSASKGFLPPRMTTAERDNISSPATGLEVYNITTNRPEFFDGSVWSGTAGNETLAETLVNGNVTGGTDIVLSSGDAIISPSGVTGVPINIVAGIGTAGNGGAITLIAGDDTGATGSGGPVQLTGGNGIGGGNIDLTAGNGTVISSGNIVLLAGRATTVNGGNIDLTAGEGGTLIGDGGVINIAGGDAQATDENGGSVFIDGGVGLGTGSDGAVVIQALSGNVGIGVTDPDAKLELNGQIKITGGVPAAGRVLTSDIDGLATWEPSGAGSGTLATTLGNGNTSGGSDLIMSTGDTLQAENVTLDNLDVSSGSVLLSSGDVVVNQVTPSLLVSHAVGSLPTSIQVVGSYAYVTDDLTGELYIIDVTDPTSPVTVSITSIGTFPQDMKVVGHYAYILDNDTAELEVVDVSNPTAPVIVSSISIPGGNIQDLTVVGRYAYILDISSSELKVIDISNPETLEIVGTLGVGTLPEDITIQGHFAYLIDTFSNDLRVIDITDPTAPTTVGTLVVGSDPKSIAVAGTYAYITDGGSSDLKVVDVSDPTTPVVVGSLVITGSPDFVQVAGRFAYITESIADEFIVVDISDPTTPVLVSTLVIPGATPTGLAIVGRYAYIIDRATDDLKIIEIAGVSTPSANIDSLSAGALSVKQDVIVGNALNVMATINVGGDIKTDGGLSAAQTSTFSAIGVNTPTSNSLLNVVDTPTGVGAWATEPAASANNWNSVAFGNGLYVAVSSTGTGNRVMTSTDGETWKSQTPAADNSWLAVTFGNNLFVAVAATGGNRVQTSPDGITWTAQSAASAQVWVSVVFGAGLFVAVAPTGTANGVMTSPDGITWTTRVPATDNQWQGITFGDDLFVAVADSGTGNRVMTSPDGIAWTTRTSAANNSWQDVTFGNGQYVAVADSGTGNRVQTSPDGIDWTLRTSAVDNQWSHVTFGNGLFVAVSITGTNDRCMTSPDGITWSIEATPSDEAWGGVVFDGDSSFLAVASNGVIESVMILPLTADNSHAVRIDSTISGFLPPRMNTVQLNNITNPIEGLQAYNVTARTPVSYDGVAFRDLSRVGQQTIEVFTAADLDALASGGIITISSQIAIIMKANVTTSNRFDVNNGSRFTIGAGGQGYALTYDAADIFITAVDSIVVVETSLTATGGGTLFDVSGKVGNIINIDFVLLTGWKMGTIRRSPNVAIGPDVFFIHMSCLDWQDTLTLENVSVLGVDEVALIPFAGSGVAFIEIKGDTPGSYNINLISGSLAGGESLVRIDPGIADDSRILISGSTMSGVLFDTSGFPTGTFTTVTDASVSAEAITSVTNSSGVARFNFTAPPTLFVNQEVVISTFTTNTAYNGTFIITATGANFFEVASIVFGSNETGSFLSNSITISETSTVLLDGDTIVINTDLATDYDGGATVYNKLTNSFQINRVYNPSGNDPQTGLWDANGINQEDPRVLANNNPGFVNSKYIACGNVNNNTEVNGAIVNNTFTDMTFGTGAGGLVASTTIERWKLIDPILGIFEYTGNEPFDGLISFDFTVTSSGGTTDFRFKWEIDTGTGFGNLPDNVEALAAVGSDAQSVTKTFPLQASKGDQIKPQITRNSGASSITTSYATVFATQ